jgi:hypothetical protein
MGHDWVINSVINSVFLFRRRLVDETVDFVG